MSQYYQPHEPYYTQNYPNHSAYPVQGLYHEQHQPPQPNIFKRAEANKNKFFKYFCYFIILILAIVEIVLLAELGKAISGSPVYDLDSSDFALYKNSRFEECYSLTPPPEANCSGWLDGFKSIASDSILINANDSKSSIDWCTAVSCLNGYKIVPTSPKPAAFGLTGLMIWLTLNFTCATTVYTMMGFTVENKHERGDSNCKGIRWYNWGFIALSAVLLGYWLYDVFIAFHNGRNAAPVSLFAWFSVWLYSRAIQHHPIACALDGKDETRHRAMTALFIIFWIAAIFTSACAGLMATGTGLSNPTLWPKYKCVGSLLNSAPGQLTGNDTCSLDNVCSSSDFNRLFASGSFTWKAGLFTALTTEGSYAEAFFIFLLIVCVLFTFFTFFSEWNGPPSADSQMSSGDTEAGSCCGAPNSRSVSIFVIFALLLLLALPTAGTVFNNLAESGSSPNREAVVTFDTGCRVAHVSMSVYKAYFDIPSNKVNRILQAVFNA